MPIRKTEPKPKPKWIHRDDIEPELHRYLVGQLFTEQYVDELRQQTENRPAEEVFVPAKPLDLKTIPPSKRNIKTEEQLKLEEEERQERARKFKEKADRTNAEAKEAYEKTQNKIIWDERPVPIIPHKEGFPVLKKPGIMWTIGGAPALIWDSQTGEFSIASSDAKISWGLGRVVKTLLDDGFELNDIAAEVFWELKSRGYSVHSIHVATEEDFEEVEDGLEQDVEDRDSDQ